MESRRFIPFLIILALAACQSPDGGGTGILNGSSSGASSSGSSGFGFRSPETNYWHQQNVTADNVPNIIKAQDILEYDLAACGYEKRARNYMAKMNDPVSTNDKGDVVDEKGEARRKTPLPTSYTVRQCMEEKGWVKLKHYYTTPY